MADTAKKPEGAKKETHPFRVWFTLALSFVLVFLYMTDRFEDFENRWEDRMHLLRGIRPGDKRVVLVAIDDKSIAAIGTYPWPRHIYAPLIENLNKMGAKVIGFDVLFIEASRPEEDKALIAAVKKAGNIVLAVDLDPDSPVNVWKFTDVYAPLKKVASSMGLVNMVLLDPDGSARQAPLMLSTARNVFDPAIVLKDPERKPALGLAMVAAYEGRTPESYVDELGPVVRLNIAGQRDWDEQSKVVINGKRLVVHKTEYGFPRISAIDVITGQLRDADRARLKGSLVLVGSTAIGAYDHYPTPFTPQAPGMEVHANIIDNILQRNYQRWLPKWIDLVSILILTFIPVALIRLSPLWGGLASAGIILGWLGLSFELFLHRWRLASVTPVIGLSADYVVLLIQRILAEQREKRWIKNTFGQYLSPKVVDALVSDPGKLKLGGEKRDMSVFFLDIAHFTTISEKMDPEALTHFLNKYLTALTNVILKNDGVVDKYIGDCIMAFWNAPVDQPRHRELACLSAIECQEAIARLNKELLSNEMPEQPAIRIGVNAGDCVVGNMGSETRFSYTVIGDVVNLASRLEGANKFFGSNIMASEDVFQPDIQDKFEARELGRVRVVGKAIPIKVFELWGKAGSLAPERKQALDAFKEGQKLFYARKFEEAAELFKKAAALFPEDKVFQIYTSAAQDYALLPPGDDWDGVFNLTSK